MENVYLIGKLNHMIVDIHKALQKRYNVYICEPEIEKIWQMVSTVKADLVVISMFEIEKLDERLIPYLQSLNEFIPIIFVGTIDEYQDFVYLDKEGQISFIERPISHTTLLRKCRAVLDWSAHKAALKEKIELEQVRKSHPQQKKILVVDDSGIALRSVKSMLDGLYDVIISKSGERALALARVERPDLVLLDYEMPGMNGKELLEHLREEEGLKNIPAVFLTAISDKAHVMSVLKLQPQGYLLKPIERETLLAMIVKILGE